MKRFWMAAVAAAALIAAPAFADDNYKDTSKSSNDSISGDVVKFAGNMLWLKANGAVIPIKVDKNTSIDDRKMLKEGSNLDVTVKIVNSTQNLATRIDSGTGGSGLPSDSGSNSNGDSFKDRAGTGGSGSSSGDINDTPAIPERSPGQPVGDEPMKSPPSDAR